MINPFSLKKNDDFDAVILCLCVAMVISVWTRMRLISAVGLSELIVLVLGGYLNKIKDKRNDLPEKRIFSYYFSLVCFLSPLGIIWNFCTIFKTSEMIHDSLAFLFDWYFVALVLQRVVYKEKSLKIIYYLLLVEIFMNLYYLKMYRSGVGFYMDTRFAGFSTDPNQLAESVFMVPWLSLYFIVCAYKRKLPIITIIIACISLFLAIYIGMLTDSDSFTLASEVGLLVWCISISVFTNKKIFIIIPFIMFIYIIVSKFDEISSKMLNYYNETANKSNQLDYRIRVWKNGLYAFFYSPIVGNGPGSYSGQWRPFGGAEPHNTYIYILMDYGIIGFIAFFSILSNVYKKVIKTRSPSLLAAVFSLFIFCFFHSFHRMPLFWFFLMLFLVLPSEFSNS